jgi:hypothetical protein
MLLVAPRRCMSDQANEREHWRMRITSASLSQSGSLIRFLFCDR